MARLTMEPETDERRKANYDWMDEPPPTPPKDAHFDHSLKQTYDPGYHSFKEAYNPENEDDTYKTVIYEQAHMADIKRWPSQRVDMDLDTSKTAVLNYSETDTNKYAVDPESGRRYRGIAMITNMSRKRKIVMLSVILGLVLIAIIVGVVAGVEVAKKQKSKGGTFFEGSDISATNRGDDTQIFYQDGSGKVVTLACAHPAVENWDATSKCGPTNDTKIANAKTGTSLTSVNSTIGVTLFYINTKNQLLSQTTPASPLDGALAALNIQTHEKSRLSAIFCLDSNTGTVRLFYQDPTEVIQEVVLTDTWATGSALGPAVPGSKLSSATWDEWSDSDPNQTHQIRTYHQATNNTFSEMAWSKGSGWYQGPWYLSAPILEPEAGLASATWSTTGANGFQLEFHDFSIDTSGSLLDFGPTLAPVGIKAGASNVLKYDYLPSPKNPIAAVYWPESNSTSKGLQAAMRVYYQMKGNDTMLGEYMWSDTNGNGAWKLGNGIPLRSI